MNKQVPRFALGFTLVEVTVALGVILASILVIGTFVYASLVRQATSHEATASRIVTDQLEKLKAADWETLPSSGTIVHEELGGLVQGSGWYTVALATSSPDIKEVHVMVEWAGRNATRTYKQSTFLTHDGI